MSYSNRFRDQNGTKLDREAGKLNQCEKKVHYSHIKQLCDDHQLATRASGTFRVFYYRSLLHSTMSDFDEPAPLYEDGSDPINPEQSGAPPATTFEEEAERHRREYDDDDDEDDEEEDDEEDDEDEEEEDSGRKGRKRAKVCFVRQHFTQHTQSVQLRRKKRSAANRYLDIEADVEEGEEEEEEEEEDYAHGLLHLHGSRTVTQLSQMGSWRLRAKKMMFQGDHKMPC